MTTETIPTRGGYYAQSTTDDWPTPAYLYDPLNRTYGTFNLDPCGQIEHHYAAHAVSAAGGRVFDGSTEALDGYRQPWGTGGGDDVRVFMNPPFAPSERPCRTRCTKRLCVKRGRHTDVFVPGLKHWVAKAFNEVKAGRVQLVCALLPARTEAGWWQRYCVRSVEWATWDAPVELLALHFVPGRVHFGNPPSALAAPFPSAVVVWAQTGRFRSRVRQPTDPLLELPAWRDVPRTFKAAGIDDPAPMRPLTGIVWRLGVRRFGLFFDSLRQIGGGARDGGAGISSVGRASPFVERVLVGHQLHPRLL